MRANINKLNSRNNPDSCQWKGCEEYGEFPAPKSPQNARERYHFCIEHVRKYNKSWDFFAGMSGEQIEAFKADSVTGHRPTFKMGHGRYYTEDDLREAVFDEFGFSNNNEARQNETPDNEKKALDVLGLKAPVTLKDIKIKYKELAKRYHPDVNDSGNDEKLKLINQAYSFLKKSY